MRGMLAGLLLLAGAGGCWKSKSPYARRSTFDRDPLVMAHLTHPKDRDYARSESELAAPDDVPPVQAASLSSSKKPALAGASGYAKPQRGKADDYSWLRGQVSKVAGVWRVKYGAAEDDRFSGSLALAPFSALAMLREGDEVYLAGKLLPTGADPQYQTQSVTLVK